MPQLRLTPELIAAWKGEPYVHNSVDSFLRIAECLQAIWDLSRKNATKLVRDHDGALEVAAIQGHSILRTAYTVGWLDIESGKSIILASLGSREGDDVG